MPTFAKNTGCKPSYKNGLCACGKIVKIPLDSGADIRYTGPNLPGTGIKTCDTVDEALKKIDLAILDLKNRVLALENQ